MTELTIKIHRIDTDGLPDVDKLTDRVAFLCLNGLVTGRPLNDGSWKATGEVYITDVFPIVTHWVEFPRPIWSLDLLD
jgi:hypothetical protein